MDKIFISAPISGFENQGEYQIYKSKILRLVEALRSNGYIVCTELEKISGLSSYDAPDKSVEEDFKSIEENDLFLMIHPKKMQTSSLIELGYAVAKEKKIVFIADKDALPYLAKGLIDSGNAVQLDLSVLDNVSIIIKGLNN